MSPKLPVWCIMEAFSPMVKQLEREADCSPPSSPEDKNSWSSTFPLLFAFMVCCLIMHTHNFKFASSTYICRYVCVIMLEQLQNVI